MNLQIPKKLNKPPLIEALFEIRFEPTTPAAGDLLLGLLYDAIKTDFPDVIPLPMANVPRQIRDQPDFLYQATHRLTKGPNAVSIGHRVVSLSSTQYPGWNRFKVMVEAVLKGAQSTKLIKKVERFSFRYVNIIEAPDTEKQLSFINARIEIIGKPPLERGFNIRVERDEGKFTTIIQVIPNSRARIPATEKEVSGLLIDLDTVSVGLGNEFLTDHSSFLEEAHSVLERTFFSLLAPSTLKKMEPQG